MTNESQLPQRVEGPRMIRTLTVEGYRGLQQFTLDGLARVNLLVGSNNSGKTTVLEAIELLATRMDLDALWRTLQRRVEQFPRTPTREADTSLTRATSSTATVSTRGYGSRCRQHPLRYTAESSAPSCSCSKSLDRPNFSQRNCRATRLAYSYGTSRLGTPHSTRLPSGAG